MKLYKAERAKSSVIQILFLDPKSQRCGPLKKCTETNIKMKFKWVPKTVETGLAWRAYDQAGYRDR